MKGGPSVQKRMRAISSVYQRREERRVTRILCGLEGIDPDAFEAEYRHWEARLKAVGAITVEEQLAYVADELGVPIAEVAATARELAEARRLLGG